MKKQEAMEIISAVLDMVEGTEGLSLNPVPYETFKFCCDGSPSAMQLCQCDCHNEEE